MLSLISSNSVKGPQEKEFIRLMEHEIREQIETISEALDLRAVTEAGSQTKLEQVDALATMNSLVASFQPLAKSKNIAILLQHQHEDHHCLGNPNYLKRVAENLISNALKYSGPNSEITIRLARTEERLCLSIRDEGPGIDERDMTKLYTRFQRLSARPTGGENSSGLGLSIVKKYVDAMNGTIQCTSEKGKGTSFTVKIPLASSQMN